jgi:hypothetical protein
MNYAAGQMASVVRLVSTDPSMPFERVVRTVPLLQRQAWQPWPWRLWGGPSLAYGRSLADYPGIQPYVDLRPYGYGYEPPYEGWGEAPYEYEPYAVAGQAPPMDVRAAAQVLAAAIHAAAAHGQPPAWQPTFDFQHAFNHAFGPLGGLGTPARPELLRPDGIYGPRTELALGRFLGGLQQVMALYQGAPAAEAAAGALDIVGPSIHRYRASGRASHQTDILAGTNIDPQLAAAVQQLATLLLNQPGVQGVADNAARGIDVFVLVPYLNQIHAYVERVLQGAYMGFPIIVRPSGAIVAQ